MICISINQESRRMALADMLNASPLCDMMEIRLDRFGKAPDLSELMQNKRKPVIMSCRRTCDGGLYEGSEEERLALLRQCIISKAEYVEIEMDVADQIRRFPPTQRIISYTNMSETPEDILDIYNEALTKSPDIVKLTTLARTPEEAWPLVQILAKQRVPTVVVGLGKPGLMLSLLGKKIGAPFTFAALERGMEAYPGQPTVTDLQDTYHYHEIGKSTRLVAVTGFSDSQYLTVALLNAVMHHCDLPYRCLPMGVGSIQLFRKVLGAAKMSAVIVAPEFQQSMLQIDPELHGSARRTSAVDLLLNKDDTWHGFYIAANTWLAALTQKIGVSGDSLAGKICVVAGLNTPARVVAQEILNRGGGVIIASHRRKEGQALAQQLECRFSPVEAIYTTTHDALIVCEDESGLPGSPKSIHTGYLKPGMTVMDLTAEVRTTQLIRDAESRSCNAILPRDLMLDHLAALAKQLTGKPVPRDVLENAIPPSFEEFDD